MNEQNLIPLNKRTKSEQREIAAQGGKASGESRAFAKHLKEAVKKELAKVKTPKGGEPLNGYEAVAISLVREAVKGNVMAARELARLLGEDVQKVELKNNQPNGFFVFVAEIDGGDEVITARKSDILNAFIEDIELQGGHAIILADLFRDEEDGLKGRPFEILAKNTQALPAAE